jgi:hypothetical protein
MIVCHNDSLDQAKPSKILDNRSIEIVSPYFIRAGAPSWHVDDINGVTGVFERYFRDAPIDMNAHDDRSLIGYK